MQCKWSRGCGQQAFDGDHCTYHGKVTSGLITTTRGEYGREVTTIRLAPAAEEKARRERERLWDEAMRQVLEREQEGWQRI